MSWMRRTAVLVLCLAAVAVPAAGQHGDPDGEDDRAAEYYERGREYLDDGEWDRAVRSFDKVIAMERSNAPGAYYWKAYALGKQGRRNEAVAVLARMSERHPDSRWHDDARALALELEGSRGKPPRPESEDDEELKLIALNALMHVDAERALPMLRKILDGAASPRLKEEALFVLIQTGSPEARKLVLDIARGRSHPDLRYRALEYVGMFGEAENLPLLREIYASTSDPRAKRAIVQSFGIVGAAEELERIAGNEPDEDLRREAISALGHTGAEDVLLRIYEASSSVEDKVHVLEALGMSAHTGKLTEIAAREKNPELRKAAIRSLAWADDPEVGDFLEERYSREPDSEVKEAILGAMAMSGNVHGVIAIARRESDPELRRAAVEALAHIDAPEATEFLLEILNK